MSAAHGGQIVCTDIVAELTAGTSTTRSLGEHELRGVAAAIRIHQVVGDGLPADFGPLRTLESVRTNLPYELTAPVGRQDLVAEVAELASTGRLVTLTGVGGVGKTTVALGAGRQLLDGAKHGVWLVELAAVTRPELIAEAVAAALRFSPPGGVPLRDALVAYLQGRELVLLLDNCEQIVDAVAETVRWLLSACASVRVLATSREALRVPGEQVVVVPPLEVPTQDSATEVLAAAAGELFLSRAVEAGAIWRLDERNAPAVAQLCRRLDGVPLALELAAARSAQLSVEAIASRLGARLDVLSGRRSGEARHRSLVAALEWSYELLEPGEQNLLRQLAVFVDGFDVDGVVAVAVAAGGRGVGSAGWAEFPRGQIAGRARPDDHRPLSAAGDHPGVRSCTRAGRAGPRKLTPSTTSASCARLFSSCAPPTASKRPSASWRTPRTSKPHLAGAWTLGRSSRRWSFSR